jgi:hypothetical protein
VITRLLLSKATIGVASKAKKPASPGCYETE